MGCMMTEVKSGGIEFWWSDAYFEHRMVKKRATNPA